MICTSRVEHEVQRRARQLRSEAPQERVGARSVAMTEVQRRALETRAERSDDAPLRTLLLRQLGEIHRAKSLEDLIAVWRRLAGV